MKITKVKRNSSGQPCEYEEFDAPYAFDDDSEPYQWIKIRTKSMTDLMLEFDCWFDCYGNLCSDKGLLAPSHFADLGRTFHVAIGCGWDLNSDWIRYD